MNSKSKIVDILKYFFLFLFFFSVLFIIGSENNYFDFLWNYGFSHAIRIGEIPYLDFNTVSTPLYIFIMSLGLFIHDSFFVFILEQAILCTFLFYLLFKYIGKRGWIFLPILSFPTFIGFIGTYNFLTLILLVYLFYLEDHDSNDYFIGFVLGLLFFSKQTIGGISILFHFLFLLRKKSFKKVGRRFIGLLIPLIYFFIYFMVTGSLFSFIDLCFLGLFNFGNSNHFISILTFISILMLIFIFFYYLKYEDIKCCFAVGAFFFVFPIFDFTHFIWFLTIFVLLILHKVELNDNYLKKISFVAMALILFFNIAIKFDFYRSLDFLHFNGFDYFLLEVKQKENFYKIYNKYKKYDNAYMISNQAMLFDIATDRKITYFDLTLRGNYGYQGTDLMISKVSELSDIVFFVDVCQLQNEQNDEEFVAYIIENSKKIDSVLCYNVYYKE